jgi:uncharacterized protein YjeT (DUF2065 family)
VLAKRIKECVGLVMIGEGVLAALRPRGYARLWEGGPSWWRQMIEPFVRNPDLTRAVGVVEALAGYWLAVRQLPEQATTD